MSKHFFDFEDGDFAHTISDNIRSNRIFQNGSESLPTLLSVITLTGRRFLAHLHPAEHYTPIRNVLVECVFSCQGAWTN